MFSGKLSSALPIYTLPLTTVGDEVTSGSLMVPLQICVHSVWPHGVAFQASSWPVFRPAYTTPLAIVGEEMTAACSPLPKSCHNGAHTAWPQPVALNTPTPSSSPMYTRLLNTAGEPSMKSMPFAPCQRG